MEISQEKVVSRDIIALLEEHLADMHATSPPESVHALDVRALQAKDICFFTARENGVLLGCVAVKQLSASDAELKSMHTSRAARNRGVGAALLNAALAFCKQQPGNWHTGLLQCCPPALSSSWIQRLWALRELP